MSLHAAYIGPRRLRLWRVFLCWLNGHDFESYDISIRHETGLVARFYYCKRCGRDDLIPAQPF